MNNPDGYTALDLVGYTDQGDYNATKSYVANDLVHYGGSIWCCLIDDTVGITPTEGVNWRFWVENSQNGISDIVNILGAKNLLKVRTSNMTLSGVTFTVNSDTSISVNGTATSDVYYPLGIHNFGNVSFATDGSINNSNYKINGLPTNSQFYLFYNATNNYVNIVVKSGYTVNNVRVYPMIRPKNIEDATWQPYTKTNKELTEEVTQNRSDIQTLTNKTNLINTEIANGFAPILTTLVADRAYRVGEKFLYNGVLYKVTTYIASGATIVINGNVEVDKGYSYESAQIGSQAIFRINSASNIALDANFKNIPFIIQTINGYVDWLTWSDDYTRFGMRAGTYHIYAHIHGIVGINSKIIAAILGGNYTQTMDFEGRSDVADQFHIMLEAIEYTTGDGSNWPFSISLYGTGNSDLVYGSDVANDSCLVITKIK